MQLVGLVQVNGLPCQQARVCVAAESLDQWYSCTNSLISRNLLSKLRSPNKPNYSSSCKLWSMYICTANSRTRALHHSLCPTQAEVEVTPSPSAHKKSLHTLLRSTQTVRASISPSSPASLLEPASFLRSTSCKLSAHSRSTARAYTREEEHHPKSEKPSQQKKCDIR